MVGGRALNQVYHDIDFELFCAIIDQRDTAYARSLYAKAVAVGADPISFVIARGYENETSIYRRASEALDLSFSRQVPSAFEALPSAQTESLGYERRICGTLYGREVIFLSPTLDQLRALKLDMLRDDTRKKTVCIVPPRALKDAQMHANTILLFELTRQRLARKWPFASAHLELTRLWRTSFAVMLAGLIVLCVAPPFPIASMVLLLLFLFLPAWIRLVAIATQRRASPRLTQDRMRQDELPVYSVLVPLRDEAHMVPELARNLRALDYPPERLEVVFVVEAKSAETVAAVKRELDTPYFSLVSVPHAPPYTKPKALNYALPRTRGEIVVVYDAEDRPAPDQLQMVAAKFTAQPELDCVQCHLLVENADTNWLTALFAAEYGSLFGVLLPALADWNCPVPLGGTSNHFRMRALREVGGWDSFNVTEDADLGVRLARLRYRVDVMQSFTHEAMPETVNAWLAQRTRWMKGWMQTFLVHNRHPLTLLRDLGWRNFMIFEVLIGGMILSAPLHVVFLICLIARLMMGETIPLAELSLLQAMQYLVLITGWFSAIALSISGLSHLKRMDLLRHQILLPLYWGLISLAGVRAAYQLVRRPYFWAKTTHAPRIFAVPEHETKLAGTPHPSPLFAHEMTRR